MSLYSGRFIHESEIYKLTLAYLDLGIRKRFSFSGCRKLGTILAHEKRSPADATLGTHLDASFFFCTIVDTRSNHVPSTVNISHVPTP